MGRPGSCNTCYRPDRKAIDDAHRAGAPTRDLARRFGIAESSLRKHFKHARAAAAPKAPTVARPAAPAPVADPAPARYTSGPTRGAVTFTAVQAAAEALGIPVHQLALCVSEHVGYDVTVTGDDEEEQLYAEFDLADEDADYVADVARHGLWLAGAAGGGRLPSER